MVFNPEPQTRQQSIFKQKRNDALYTCTHRGPRALYVNSVTLSYERQGMDVTVHDIQSLLFCMQRGNTCVCVCVWCTSKRSRLCVKCVYSASDFFPHQSVRVQFLCNCGVLSKTYESCCVQAPFICRCVMIISSMCTERRSTSCVLNCTDIW